MIVGVLLKQVPASDTRIRINADGTGIMTDDVKWEINAYDDFAFEAALKLREANIASKVFIITLAGADAEARLRDALARCTDPNVQAVRLDDPAFAGSDALGKARVLAAAARKLGCELILAGKQAIDDDNSQVPAMVAEVLDWAQVSVISSLEIAGGVATVQRDAGGGNREVVQAQLPAVLTCDKGLNTPRSGSLKGIMDAKKKTTTVWKAADLGVDPASVGVSGAVVIESNYTLPPPRPAGRVIDGATPEAKVKELVRLLREEAKVI